MSNPVVDLIGKLRFVAVIRLDDLSMAEPLTRALMNGGVLAIEFTLTNRDSLQVIADVRQKFPEIAEGKAVVGAGSVNSVDDCKAAIDAGAQFIVSPSTKFPVIETAKAAGVVVTPGAFTPTEIEDAWQAGADAVKIFPASFLGPGYVKAVLAPLPHLKLIPTGGVDDSNVADYIKNGAFAVGAGSNLLDKKAIAAGDWEAVSAHAAKFAQAVAAV